MTPHGNRCSIIFLLLFVSVCVCVSLCVCVSCLYDFCNTFFCINPKYEKFFLLTNRVRDAPNKETILTGGRYSFSVMIVFNFVLFIMIAAGQLFIYWSIKSNAVMATDKNM